MRIGDIRLGTDKLEHIWAVGRVKFSAYYMEGKELARAMAFGWNLENGKLGVWTTGVFPMGIWWPTSTECAFGIIFSRGMKIFLGKTLVPMFSAEKDVGPR